MRFPVHDWQFWVVTAICAAAAWWVLKSLLPRFRRRRRGRPATLTIEGRPARRARPARR